MSTIICFANNKGGVGKSTLTLNLGGALSEMGKKILLIDLDAQANLTSLFVENPQKLGNSLAEVFYEDIDVNEAIRATQFPNLSIVPASSSLAELDSRLAGDDDAQFFLAEELTDISEQFDYVLIDCPPNLGKATRMALVASDYVVVPIQCQDWSVKGCQYILAHIKRVQQRVNPKLRLLGIVVNGYHSRRRMEQLYLELLRKSFDGQIFQTIFPNNVPFEEAVTAKMPLTIFKPRSRQAEVCQQFTQEVIDRVQE